MSNQAGQNTDVHVEPVGPFQTNAFFLRKKDSDEVIFVDPGDEADHLIEVVESRGWKPVAILNTHAHIDHMGAVQGMKARFSIPFYLHRSELPVLENTPKSARNWGIPVPEVPEVDHLVEDNETLDLAGLTLKVLFTPGHTPGGASYLTDGRVFGGDCLFFDSIGRTDFPGGNTRTLMDSLRSRFLSLPDDTLVHCGHGPDTTIGREREHNPFLTAV